MALRENGAGGLHAGIEGTPENSKEPVLQGTARQGASELLTPGSPKLALS